MFITLEGGEGAGKSTQLCLLAETLERARIPYITTREPGGSKGAEAIRELLVTGEVDRWNPRTETLLFMTARYDHVAQTIKPALDAGKWVLCDRFYDSTRIYQGIGKGVDSAWLEFCYRFLFGDFKPDITLILDLPPEVGLLRANTRRGNETRFESMPLDYHYRIREGFQALCAAEPERCVRIDAENERDITHRKIVEAIEEKARVGLL